MGLRLLHLVSFSIFVGSVCTVFALKLLAERFQSDQLSGTLGHLQTVDKVVTAPSAILLALTGIGLLLPYGTAALTTFWILALIALWIIGLSLAHLWAIPQLKLLVSLARVSGGADDAYKRMSRSWNGINIILISLLMIATVVAVYKPYS